MAEGLHIKIKATKRRVCGYCSEEPFKSKFCGSLGLRSQKLVFGAFWFGENPRRFLFLKPNPPIDAMITKVSLIVY
jgi:hypothetical protein